MIQAPGDFRISKWTIYYPVKSKRRNIYTSWDQVMFYRCIDLCRYSRYPSNSELFSTVFISINAGQSNLLHCSYYILLEFIINP